MMKSAASASDYKDGKLLVRMYSILCSGLRMLIARRGGKEARVVQSLSEDRTCWQTLRKTLSWMCPTLAPMEVHLHQAAPLPTLYSGEPLRHSKCPSWRPFAR